MSTYQALLNHAKDLYKNNLIDNDTYKRMNYQLKGLKHQADIDKNKGIIYRTIYELKDNRTNGTSKIPHIDNYADFFKVLASTDKLGISKDFDLICIKSKQIGNKTEILSKQNVPLESLRLSEKNLELTALRSTKNNDLIEEQEESLDDYSLEI